MWDYKAPPFKEKPCSSHPDRMIKEFRGCETCWGQRDFADKVLQLMLNYSETLEPDDFKPIVSLGLVARYKRAAKLKKVDWSAVEPTTGAPAVRLNKATNVWENV